MNSVKSPAWVYGLLCALLGLFLCQVPLFNLLGYESSLALALLAAAAGAHLGVAAVRRRRREQTPAEEERALARPARAVFGLFASAFLLAGALLLFPLLFLLLNGLRVRNCAYLTGLSFYLMMPVCSAACGAALGTVAGLWTRTPRRGLALAGSGILLSLLWAGWRFLAAPAIYAYDPFFGYFPGALYDEEVAITGAFCAARAYHALCAGAGLALSAALLQPGLRCRPRRLPLRARTLLLALALALTGAAATGFAFRGELGIHRSAAYLRTVLSKERRTPHFVLRYAPGGPVARDIDLLAREHELRYQQLRDTLQVTPSWAAGLLGRLLVVEPARAAEAPPVVSYLFDSAERKQRLMGAARTYIAKPWRREIYLQHEAWPHPTLKHELAHVFLGAAGDPLLRLSLLGPIPVPNPALVEGAAEAADWSGGRLTLHQAVKALKDLRLLPPLERVFGLSFYALPSTRAYPLAGSFCRYLLVRSGAAPLLQVYRQGGGPAAFRRAYGVPLAELEAEWLGFIDRQPLAPTDREVERERVRRPAIFHRVCAHELAVRREHARAAQARGNSEEAQRLLASICRDDPYEPRHLVDLMDLLWSEGLRAQAAQAAERLLSHPSRSALLEARAVALLGDAAWLAGDAAEAGRRYRQAAALPADEAAARLLATKLLALAHPRAGPLVLRVLVGDPEKGLSAAPDHDGALDPLFIAQAVQAEPDFGLWHYLLGRQLFNHGAHGAAAAALARSLGLGLPDERFERQAGRLLGQARLRSGDPAGAQAGFERLLQATPPAEAGSRAELEDWLDRVRRWPSLPTGK